MSLGVARSPLRAVFAKAVAAVNPRQLIERLVHVEHKTLIVQEQSQPRKVHRFPFSGRVLLVGAGKGAGPLAEQLEIVLGPDLASGVVVVPCGQTLALQRVQCIEGDHPLPGEGSVRGAQAITALLQKKELGVLVCFCLTGGASSLLVSPVTEISLADKIAVNQLLLACGADIHELNTVRKHLSRLKGGGLARHTFPLTTVSFILSDVIDDDLSTIGSGPTVPDNSTFHDAWAVLQKYALLDRLPPPVHAYLFAGCQGKRPETPKLGDEIFSSVHNFLIGSNRLALAAAAEAARSLHFTPHVLSTPLSSDTTVVAREFAATLHELLLTVEEPTCVLAGGETTVHVSGSGRGGRNQEFALVVAEALKGQPRWALLSAGTDGIDGPTDAAGAFVDGETTIRGQNLRLSSSLFLQNNDSYSFFSQLGDLFSPGPTCTNVMDIKIALLWPYDSR